MLRSLFKYNIIKTMCVFGAMFAGFVVFRVVSWIELDSAIKPGDLVKAEQCLKLGAQPTQEFEDDLSWVTHLLEDRKIKEAKLIVRYGALIGNPDNQYLKDMYRRWDPERRQIFESAQDFQRFPPNWPN